MSQTAQAQVTITHGVGLHARPSVKLTKLAKTFAAQVELALSPDGPWFDAKSIVKVMAAKAPKGTVLYLRADRRGRRAGARSVGRPRRARFRRGQADAEAPATLRLRGIAASPGFAAGPLFALDRPAANIWRMATRTRGRRAARRDRSAPRTRIADLIERRAPKRGRDPRVPARHAGGRGADRPGLRGNRRRHAGR